MLIMFVRGLDRGDPMPARVERILVAIAERSAAR